eukprot:TRINITY_DN2933_c0_g1_i2.p1 TRINITY_DN2933_c0_g1~~TRINITY_DN2933_c0_g1_i2.p1  ORF type:complete len:308 (+),score=54.88 TRINITY_DN2933_c0_g1_i2:61-924(+)
MAQPVFNVGKLIKWTLGAGTALSAAYTSFFTVDGGHRAVIFDRFSGVKPETKGEGLNFIIPFIQYPFIYETRTRYTNIASETGSKDLQTVGVNLRLLFRPEAHHLATIHSQLGPDYDERVLPSISNEVLKAVVAQYDAGELITQRENVSLKIREALTQRASEFNICLDDVSITHVSFSPEFTTAIESKQVAQQEAERSKFLVAKAEQEKKASIIRASGEAEAARLIIDAIQGGPGFIELRRVEAMREISDTLSKSRNIVWLPQGMNMLMTAPPMGGGPSQPPSNSGQ